MLNELKQIQELVAKIIVQMEIPETKFSSQFFSQQGKKGSEILKQKLINDPDYYRRIGQKGVEARRAKRGTI